MSAAQEGRCDVETSPARGPGADNRCIPPGYDYEYDEAHDVPAGPLRECRDHIESIPHRGYTSARAGTLATTRPTISVPDDQPRRESAHMSELVTDRLKHS